MPRFYVQHDGKWNVFSSIVDDFLFPEFIPFEELKAWAIKDTTVRRIRELDSLLTDRPALNVMDYREACVTVILRKSFDRYEGDPEEYDLITNKTYAEWKAGGGEPQELERMLDAALRQDGPKSH